LHGMGEPLYEQVSGPGHPAVPCRIYAPVGSHEDLLPYLVRRLLENGSNTSFVNRIVDEDSPVEAIVADPVARLHSHPVTPHPAIGLPGDLFQPERANSPGPDLTDALSLNALASEIAAVGTRPRRAAPLVGGVLREGAERRLLDPADRRRAVGRVVEADAKLVDEALTRAQGAYGSWDATPAGERAACLERTAGLLQAHRGEIMYLAIREAGKTVPDAVAELREAEDFCRYYAAWCRRHMTDAQVFAGPTGERNQMALHGRGIFACISPWNFPLAIFTGQVAAALAAGNTVVAKPAEQTPLIAARAVALLHEAGVPPDALHLLPGDGPGVGAALVQDPRVQGVAFTGSTGTAKSIQRALAERDGPIVPLIAETGGLNAMIVDSSALPEQVVADVIGSAFHSAGQRCSALRLLFLQEDIASGFLERLAGAMAELRIGDPGLLCTDVGPVIDDSAGAMLAAHSERMAQEARLIYRCKLPGECDHGSYFAPVAFEVDTAEQLRREVFGPVLHVVRYSANGLDEVIDAINASDYGLTLGIHSRVDATVAHIHKRVRVGNTYVNRNMVGAVVGVQPFGGEGLSGTGPKAGGPHYLYRFLTERTLTVNVTAQGGNADLMSLDDD
jgi:RHH-type transcriptional regulator, proline utilization regulon repressor / proline dehydrogenase / delta 1-pyrroline-5-carboxylate dehydrogenase